MYKLLLFLALAAMLQGVASSGTVNQPPTSRIRVTFLPCKAGVGMNSHLRFAVVDASTLKVVKEMQYPQMAYQPIRQLHIDLQAGFYFITLVDGDCSDALSVPVLVGHDRDILAISKKATAFTTFFGMVAGTLPVTGYSASIIYYPSDQANGWPKGRVELPVTVVNDAFYATGVVPGRARLRVYDADRTQWLEFAIGEIAVEGAGRNVVRNVSSAELAEAIAKESGLGISP